MAFLKVPINIDPKAAAKARDGDKHIEPLPLSSRPSAENVAGPGDGSSSTTNVNQSRTNGRSPPTRSDSDAILLKNLTDNSAAVKWTERLRPEAYREHLRLVEALHLAVTKSRIPSSILVGETSLALASNNSWLRHLFSQDALDKLFASEHLGNYVFVRETGKKVFEPMPIYARIGMHLLFYGSAQVRFLRWRAIRNILKAESIRQGRIYDSTEKDVVRTQIASFIETYKIDLTELAQPDISSYKTFNQFFARKLKPGARTPAWPNDPSIVVSMADCRLTVWPSWDMSRRIWVKGKNFTLPRLLGSYKLARSFGPSPTLAIHRLAPQDYHRFHAPISGTLTSLKHFSGDYYTVNPQAVNERLDVLTANTRTVAVLQMPVAVTRGQGEAQVKERTTSVPVAVVAVGALLVGSIRWEKKVGEEVEKGEGLGYFQYGGSTVVLVFPTGVVWDEDLAASSENKLEVLVKAGERIGQFM